MAQTILDLFKSRKDEIYVDEGSKAFIDSRGLINAPRKAALIAASPTAIGGIIGNELAGTIKGTAYRPTDTIYKNKTALSKPVSAWPGILTGAAYAIDSGDGVETGEKYYVKKSPGEPSFIARIKQGTTNPKEELIRAAGQILRKPTTTLKEFKDLTGKLNKNSKGYSSYAPFKSEDRNGNIIKDENGVTFTRYELKSGSLQYRGDGKELIKNGKSDFDNITYQILANKYTDQSESNGLEATKNTVNVPYVLITRYPSKTDAIYLPGTISGLSEDLSPEWSDFKYLGSPFKLYKYGGVERNIKFQLKLYYTNTETKITMKKNLDRLKQLVFPNEYISAAIYPGNNGYSPLTYTPNILFLTVNGIYKDIPCVMESLSVSIADETPWASDETSTNEVDKPYPVVIDIDMGFKVIETLDVKKGTTMYDYENYFTNPKINTSPNVIQNEPVSIENNVAKPSDIVSPNSVPVQLTGG